MPPLWHSVAHESPALRTSHTAVCQCPRHQQHTAAQHTHSHTQPLPCVLRKQALDDAKACFNNQRLVLGINLPNQGLQVYVDKLNSNFSSLKDEVAAFQAKLETFDAPQARGAGAVGVVEDTETFEDAEDHHHHLAEEGDLYV